MWVTDVSQAESCFGEAATFRDTGRDASNLSGNGATPSFLRCSISVRIVGGEGGGGGGAPALHHRPPPDALPGISSERYTASSCA